MTVSTSDGPTTPIAASEGETTAVSELMIPRLLMVTTIASTHGFLLPYARHLRAKGWRVEAATGSEGLARMRGELDNTYDAVRLVSWSRQLATSSNGMRAPGEIRRLMLSGGYDIVHVHTPIASFVTRLAAGTIPPHRRPAVVYTAHGFHFHPGGGRVSNVVYAAAERLAGRFTDRLIVINETDRAAAERLRIVPTKRLFLFPGIGLDLNWYARSPELLAKAAAVRTDLGLAPQAALYSFLAGFEPGKNHDIALKALASANDSRLHLALAGDGPRRGELEALAGRLGISEQVHFLGRIRDVRPLVLASVATILPSSREGLSRAVLESLALETPVIGGNARGVADLISDAESGRLVEPRDEAALSRALVEFAQRRRPGAPLAEVRRRMLRYSQESLFSLHEELYVGVLAGRVAAVAE